MMNARSLVATTLAVVFSLASATSEAALFSSSDAKFSWTTDTATGLEWLDFDGGPAPSTNQRPYDEVAAELGPGGDYEGWRFATRAEVYTFVLHVTGLPYLVAAPGSWTAQDGATDAVAAWTGYTRQQGTLDIVLGFTGDVYPGGCCGPDGVYYAGLFDYFIQPGQVSEYTIWTPGTGANATGVYDDLGSWLVRGDPLNGAPEPSTLALLGLAVAGLAAARPRKSSRVIDT